MEKVASASAASASDLDSLKQLKARLTSQLEYYFSWANLVKDRYLIAQMNQDQYIAISTIANFNRIKVLTDDIDLVTQVLEESPNVQVDESRLLVRPCLSRRSASFYTPTVVDSWPLAACLDYPFTSEGDYTEAWKPSVLRTDSIMNGSKNRVKSLRCRKRPPNGREIRARGRGDNYIHRSKRMYESEEEPCQSYRPAMHSDASHRHGGHHPNFDMVALFPPLLGQGSSTAEAHKAVKHAMVDGSDRCFDSSATLSAEASIITVPCYAERDAARLENVVEARFSSYAEIAKQSKDHMELLSRQIRELDLKQERARRESVLQSSNAKAAMQQQSQQQLHVAQK